MKSMSLRMNPSTCAQSCETLHLLSYSLVYDDFSTCLFKICISSVQDIP
jgi:hypothetical protein